MNLLCYWTYLFGVLDFLVFGQLVCDSAYHNCLLSYVTILDDATAYDDIWLIGDRFINKSIDVLEDYMGLFNAKTKHTQFDSYIATNYDVLAYTNDDDSVVRSVLGRLRNALAIALNENDKLPKYILIVLDTDLMKCIKFSKPGLSELYGSTLKWLFNEFHAAIVTRKNQLPAKAKKYMYPQMFVVNVPQHKNFSDNQNRHRFNQCIVFSLYIQGNEGFKAKKTMVL